MYEIIIIIWWWLKKRVKGTQNYYVYYDKFKVTTNISQLSRCQIVNDRILRKVHNTPYGFSLKHKTSLC